MDMKELMQEKLTELEDNTIEMINFLDSLEQFRPKLAHQINELLYDYAREEVKDELLSTADSMRKEAKENNDY